MECCHYVTVHCKCRFHLTSQHTEASRILTYTLLPSALLPLNTPGYLKSKALMSLQGEGDAQDCTPSPAALKA